MPCWIGLLHFDEVKCWLAEEELIEIALGRFQPLRGAL